MTLIGMLHYRRHPQTVLKTYAFAAAAKAEGADFFYFTPSKVNIEQKNILGWVLENGTWLEKVMPFPDVIYNAGSPTTDYAEYIHDYLYEHIPFTSHSIGDKFSVYERIKKAGEFSSYLIPSKLVTSPDQVLTALDTYTRIIAKPISGHKGIGVTFIEQKKEQYILIQENIPLLYNEESLEALIRNSFLNQEFIIQPYISCRTKDGHPYDFRLHVQKNGEGKWVVTTIYPRISSSPEKIVTNLSNGGYSTYLHSFLTEEFGEEYYNIKRYLEKFSIAFARHMDAIYCESFDELGIDVGIDTNQKLWLYEVNWRPGVPPTFYYEIDVARNSIRYAMYLAKQ